MSLDHDTRAQMSIDREELDDLAWRAVEWLDSFTPTKLTIQHLRHGYEYPISGDEVRRELARR